MSTPYNAPYKLKQRDKYSRFIRIIAAPDYAKQDGSYGGVRFEHFQKKFDEKGRRII